MTQDSKRVRTTLVTGGAGAIGTNLVMKLLEFDKCDRLIILDNMSSGQVNNLPNSEKIKLVSGDICDERALQEVFSERIDNVYHLAVNFANQNSVDFPERDLKTNGLGTVKLLEHCVSAGVKKFLLAGSSCVYSASKERFVEHGKLELTTPYAITKLLSEHYVTFYSKFHGLPAVIVRYFNSYGPFAPPGRFRGVVPNFFHRALNGLPLVITGDGQETRPFTYVEDVAVGTIQIMEHDSQQLNSFYSHPTDPEDNFIYNVGNENSVTIKELALKINKLCDNDAGIEYVPMRDWDVIPNRAVSIDKAKREFGFKPKHSLDEGLKKTLKWFKENNFDLE